jgi:transcriptional regulator with XRE-family HTH domain
MSRLQFARLTRIGVATLSRWERGITLPNPANDQFLRLLRHDLVFAVLARTDATTDAPRTTRSFRAIPDPTVYRSQQSAFQLRLAS